MNRFPEPVTAWAGKSAAEKRKARAADHPARSAFAGSRPAMADRAKGEWPAAGGGRGAFGLALQEPVQLFAERKARIGPGCGLANALPGRKRAVSKSGAVCALRPFTARLWTGAKRPAFAVPSGSRQQGGRGSETGANSGELETAFAPVSLGHYAMYSGANTGRCQGGRVRARVGRGSALCGPDASGISAARRVGAAGRAFAVSGAFAAGGAAGGGAPAAQGAGAAIGRAAAGLAFI